ANAVAGIDAGGNADLQGSGFANLAGAAAVVTGILDGAAAAPAGRTGLLNREETLLHAHLALATTGRAHVELATFRAAAAAGFALAQRGQVDFLFDAGDGFLKIELEGVAQILAAARLALAAPTAAEDVAEDVAENIV